MGRSPQVPERIAWTVDTIGVGAGDRILEFGCGAGVAVSLVAERLVDGRVTGIDRSAHAIARASARNAEHTAAGRAELRQVELAAFSGAPGSYDLAFGINVNLFWTGAAEAECEVLSGVLRSGGRLHLVYDGPSPGAVRDVGPAVAATLERGGFTNVAAEAAGRLVHITAERP